MVCSEEFRRGFFLAVLFLRWFGSTAMLFRRVPCASEVFSSAAAHSAFALLLPFLPSPSLRSLRAFSVLPPTRAIQDHLRCLAADTGRTRAQLLGDERSGSF
jgi:hypothetical protein